MDKIYSVSFFKKLADSTGHEVDACQGTVEVHAPNEGRAIAIARDRFAELEDVSVWSLRADYEQAELLPGRKRASSSAWRISRQEPSTTH
jgi:1,2-phenylacetyl-CoA epoxidase PaaB subunit